MEFGVCTFSIIPIRSAPLHQSEMVNQMLFGELCKISEKQGEWLHINLIHDNYEGWINQAQLYQISEEEFKRLNTIDPYHSLELVELIKNKTNNQIFSILLGSSLYSERKKEFQICETEYAFEGNQSEPLKSVDRKQLLENAYLYLHAPYLWGGRSPFGIDCSGLAQMTYKLSGVNIFRDASQQATQGETINFLSEAKKGDLAFFDNEEGEITHVGILISGNSIIHAHGKVRIDQIDHQGIYDWEKGSYTHNLRIIKSLI